ncbi:MAG: glycoside hydrolase family 3 N-terminal domain-containing protein [Pseudomonadota bacterium]
MILVSRIAAALIVTAAVATPSCAIAQAKVPFPPMDGFIERPAEHQALPLTRPSVAETVSRECQAPHPELAWAALPLTRREVPLATMVGQLVMTSYGGDNARDPQVLEATQAIARSEIGGVLAFRNNIASGADIAAINALFAGANPDLPPLIALDQEGGRVARMRSRDGVPRIPSAARVGQRSLTAAVDAYTAMARALSSAGFNVNFGPVIDLDTNPNNPIIGGVKRSYGDDPTKVTRFGRAFVNAHKDADMLTALKHFPGHGSSVGNSHTGPVNITETWARRELSPFAALTGRNGADMVMVGHLLLDAIDPGLPTSLSPNAINGLLRDALCFSGLVVSDDLSMGAIAYRWSIAQAGELFIAAGGDIIVFSGDPDERAATVKALTQRIVERANTDRDFSDKIRWAYARVVHQKLDLAKARQREKPGPDVVAFAH